MRRSIVLSLFLQLVFSVQANPISEMLKDIQSSFQQTVEQNKLERLSLLT